MDDQDRERWTKLVADFETSDLTQREFASERGISFSNLRNWIYRLRKEARPLVEAPVASLSQMPRAAPRKERSRLVPVRVLASAAKPRLVEPASALLELALPSGAVLRFPPAARTTPARTWPAFTRSSRPARRTTSTPSTTSPTCCCACSPPSVARR